MTQAPHAPVAGVAAGSEGRDTMATNQNKPAEKVEEAAEIKRKLAWRMGIAGLMIVGLLGGLALFDRLSGSTSTPVTTEADLPRFTEPVPVQKKMVTQPVTPVEPTVEEMKAAGADAVGEPESSQSPANLFGKPVATPAEPPPPPVVAAQPSLPRKASPVAVASTKDQPAPERIEESKTLAASPLPATVVIAEPPPAPVPPSAPARLMSGYALQAGVFSDTQHAEELHARLTREGIPSSIEARVQVGPFKSKAEAEATRKKLNALGIDSVLLPPKKGKR